MIDAALISSAGMVIVAAPILARMLAWRAANRPAGTAIADAPMLFVDAPHPRARHHDLDAVSPRDWLDAAAVHGFILDDERDYAAESSYEGLDDDERDGDAWVTSLREAGYTVTPVGHVSLDRAFAVATSREWEYFDRTMTRRFRRLDALGRTVINSWMNDTSAEVDPMADTMQFNLDEIKAWCTAELTGAAA